MKSKKTDYLLIAVLLIYMGSLPLAVMGNASSDKVEEGLKVDDPCKDGDV